MQSNTENASRLIERSLETLEAFEKSATPDKLKLIQVSNSMLDALRYDPNNAYAYYILAYIFYLVEEDEKAKEYLQYAFSIEPDNPEFSNLEALLN